MIKEFRFNGHQANNQNKRAIKKNFVMILIIIENSLRLIKSDEICNVI